ncbi:hypothetical protein SNE40_009277 [Patella caerulea]|uniref:Uncharacterized protein n=1 Tax=Patella caerulea TaxID=87958 RepID=A0AAN8JX34_PATCE
MEDEALENNTGHGLKENMLQTSMLPSDSHKHTMSETLDHGPLESESSEIFERQSSKPKKSVEVEDFSDDAYSEPLPDPYGRAVKYLEKHNIMQLFQSLTSSIVYNKPDDPMSFLMTEVDRIKKERDQQKETEKEIKQINPN